MTRRTMRRDMLVPGLLLAVILLPACATHVAQAPSPDPAGEGPPPPSVLRIEVDRATGLVPMQVEISGVLLDELRNEIDPAEDEKVHLQVETSHYRISGGDRSRPFHSAGMDEIDAAGLADPMMRTLQINTPGTYHFRLVLEDEEGNKLQSNTVTVKAK